jgi:hypothetical protein
MAASNKPDTEAMPEPLPPTPDKPAHADPVAEVKQKPQKD